MTEPRHCGGNGLCLEEYGCDGNCAMPQPLGIPKAVLTELVETNARLIARDPHRPECGDLECEGCRNA